MLKTILDTFWSSGQVILGKGGKTCEKRDYLDQILGKTVPVVTREILTSSEEPDISTLDDFGKTAIVKIGGIDTLVTNSSQVAHEIFKSKGKFFTQRLGNDEGLEHLGMKGRGLIWNNDTEKWKGVRNVFRKALNKDALEEARKVAEREILAVVKEALQTSISNELNFLDLMRKVTFRVTHYVFFGLSADDLKNDGIVENDVIYAVIQYFKAWEYFLFRPDSIRNEDLEAKHVKSVESLNKYVEKLVECARRSTVTPWSTVGGLANQNDLFFQQLLQLDDDPTFLNQAVLEMLLAGTDTSSVTMYYAILGLSGKDEMSRNFQRSLCDAASESDLDHFDSMVDNLVDEALRFKPVGPVIIRQAVDDVSLNSVNESAFFIPKGMGVVINIESMNRLPFWKNPDQFLLPRPDMEENKCMNRFFPFGAGPKGCIGQYLGLAEVKAALRALISSYNFEVEGETSLATLETHWDIANQPDNPPLIRCELRN